MFVVFQPSKRLRDAMQTFLRSRIKGNEDALDGKAVKSSAKLAAEAEKQEQTDA